MVSRSRQPSGPSSSRGPAGPVERWFAESNFHHGEFRDLRRLMALKEKQGVTVSLVLPTLNEAATVGPIVRRARTDADGSRAARRRADRDRLRLGRRDARDRGGEGARLVQHHVCPGTAPTAARERRSGRACSSRRATSSSGATPTSATGIRGWRSGRWAPCSSSRASSTSRATTSARSWRAACCARVVGAG